ncbi:MAG: DUF996 domain-containing protein [Pyrobaculum sp.]
MEFQTAKKLFAVGLILWIIPFINIVGLILTLIGAYGLSQHYHRRGIFWNLLYAVIVPFVGALVLFPAFLAASFDAMYDATRIFQLLTAVVIILILAPIVLILWAFFIRRAYMNLFEASNVNNFKTAAKLILIGVLILLAAIPLAIIATPLAIEFMSAVSAILGLLGVVLMFIGHIFAIIGAFRLKPPTQLLTYTSQYGYR